MNDANIITGLSQEDYDELIGSGLSHEWIKNSNAKSISVEAAVEMGFALSARIDDSYTLGTTINVLESTYVSSCLFLPFYDRHGNEIFDNVTNKQIGVIKPRYIPDEIKHLWGFKPVKYLCLPRSGQSQQYIHHPKGFDWNKFYSDPKIENLNITEGWKKAEAACSLGIPCISVYSVYCFNESVMNTPLIPELKKAILEPKVRPVIVFDSDKSINAGVDQAERMFIDKIANETKKQAYLLNLPQYVGDIASKGLDDFLKIVGKEGFDKLKEQPLYTPFVIASKISDVPSLPKDSLPEIYRAFVNYVDENFEGCIEIAPLALFCQGAVALGRTFELNGKKANFYGMGIAETTSGKSSVAREITKSIQAINKELHDEYTRKLENKKKPSDEEDSKPYSNHFIVSGFTEEGLNYFLSNVAKNPIGLFFETEEFDNFLSKLSKDHTNSLSSYVTKIYDAKYLSPSYSYERQSKGPSIKTIYEPAITIGGVGTEVGIVSAMPKNSQGTGFDNRFQKFIGKHRFGKCVVQPKPLPQELETKMQNILRLPINANIDSEGKICFRLSEEAEALYKERYKQFKDWEDHNQSNPLVPYFRRSLTDAAFKLALQFQIIIKAEEIIDQNSIDPQDAFNKWIKDSSNLFISKETLTATLEWSTYFFNTAKYFHEKYLSTDSNFDLKVEAAINILKKHPQGMLSNKLRRALGLHRNRSQKSDYTDLLEMLMESNEIICEEGKRKNSIIVRLKSHLTVTQAHVNATN